MKANCAAGVGMLAKLLSNGSSSTMPTPMITGPAKVDETTYTMTYSFKKGVLKYGIRSDFTFLGSKVVLLQYIRL